ncbi:MAG: aspartyl protease family protein [Candidatus Acidiferrales bacterium]
MRRLGILLSLCMLAGTIDAARAQTAVPSAAEILASVRQATGGAAWDKFSECDSVGTIAFQEIQGQAGSFHYFENLKTGARVLRVEVPDRGVNQAIGINANGSWKKDDAGDIRLLPANDPWDIDELYITSHGYLRADFGGATITALDAANDGGKTYDRLEIQVPRGRGFTLWINRSSHLIERIVYQKHAGDTIDAIKAFSDYRRVDGVLLPFIERSGNPGEEHTVTLDRRTLLKQVDAANFAIPFRQDYELPASGAVTVPTEGGVIVHANVNGKGPYRVLFDTGSVNLLSAEFAKKMGLRLDGDTRKFGTVGGPVDAQTAHVDTLQIGGLVLHDQTFYVIQQPWGGKDDPIGAVGYEVMRRLAVNIDYQHAQLTFYDAPKFSYSGHGVKLPLVIDGQAIEVKASIGAASGLFTLDTGNQVAFWLEPGFVKANNLIEQLGAHYRGYSGEGYGGPTPEAYYARVKTLQLGDTKVDNVIADLYTGDPAPGENAGNIGRSILQQFNVTIDLMRGELYLEKNDAWGKPGIFNRAGIVINPIDQGQKIMTVLPGCPGEAAGLKVGDIITGIGDKNPAPPGDDPDEPAFLQPVGTIVHLTVKRGDATLRIDVKLTDVL